MNEIQRYSYVAGCMSPNKGHGRIVLYDDHLADKSAALEAKDEAHDREIRLLIDKHVANLIEKDEEHEGKLTNTSLEFLERISEREEEIAELEAELAALRGEVEPTLIHFEQHRLIGEPCMIHRDFKPTMERLCLIAGRCNVDLWITHSVRYLDQEMLDLVVRKAKRSNHLAGSAVDLNVVYQGVWYTNEMMQDFASLPGPVRTFLNRVCDDEKLRWGGSFGINKDCVHFDSDLVRRDPVEWARRVTQLAEETQ